MMHIMQFDGARKLRLFADLSARAVVCSLLIAGCGGGGDASPGAPVSQSTMALFAGTATPASGLDGVGREATFDSVAGLAFDAGGTLLATDSGNSSLRAIGTNGAVQTWAGSPFTPGSADGARDTARFLLPFGIAADAAGNVYVSDAGSHSVRRIDPGGMVTTIAGNGTAGSRDGPGSIAQFNAPAGIAVDGAGNLYVADFGNSTIRRIGPDFTVATVAGAAGEAGLQDGPGPLARFSSPTGVAVDASGDVVIADPGNHAVRRLRSGSVTTLTAPFQLAAPTGIAADRFGNIYVADAGSYRVHKILPSGAVVTIAGSGVAGTADAAGPSAQFMLPRAIALAPNGLLYVADHDRVRSVTPDGAVSTLAGGGDKAVRRDGIGTAARFRNLAHISADASGTLHVIDQAVLRRVSPAAQVVTVSDQTWFAIGVASDDAGNSYATQQVVCAGRFTPDCDNTQPTRFLRFSASGEASVLAGGSYWMPRALARDASGNLYFTRLNSHHVWRLAPNGTVSSIAGGEAGFEDGIGASARFRDPAGLALDAVGNIYVGDAGNGALRRIAPSGEATTLARFPSSSFFLDVAVDARGNAYVSDSSAHVVRKVGTHGAIATIAGVEGVEGFVMGPLPGLLRNPSGLAVAGDDLFIATRTALVVIRNRP